MALSSTSKSSSRPRRWRSSGMCAMPTLAALRGSSLAIDRPPSVMSPTTRAGIKPGDRLDELASGRCPSTPAMPTISPARTSNDTRLDPARVRSGARDRDAQHRAPGRAGRAPFRHAAAPPGPPSGAPARPRWSRGLDAPDDPPVAHDGHLVGDRQHLRQLVVMMTTVLPCSRMPRRMAKNSSTSCGVSTAVGSSRISSRASR